MRLITTIIAMFFGLTVTYGQTKEICGKVFDQEDNSPIAGVIVQIKDSVGPDFITFLRHHIAHNDNQRVT